MSQTTQAIILARFSPRPDADESESNAKQVERCREYCVQRGYEVVGVYEEADVSGGGDDDEIDPAAALAGRPVLLEVLESLKRGMVLVVRWRSRLARNAMLDAWIHRRAEKVGARIEAADEANGLDPQAKLLQGILAQFAEYQRRITKFATSRGMRRRQEGGQLMTNPATVPWGFQIDPNDSGRIVPNEEEQEIAKLIVERHDAGVSYRQLAADLEAEGHERRGKWTWGHADVRRIYLRFAPATARAASPET